MKRECLLFFFWCRTLNNVNFAFFATAVFPQLGFFEEELFYFCKDSPSIFEMRVAMPLQTQKVLGEYIQI